MRYQYFISDDGRYFILDTKHDKVFGYIANELLAQKICRMLNKSNVNLTVH